MKCLIAADPADSQAVFVSLALEAMGHDVKLWFPDSQSLKSGNSLFINNMEYEWKNSNAFQCSRHQDFDVVWWRLAASVLQKQMAVPRKYQFALRENVLFYESFIQILAAQTVWINPKEASARASVRMYQLKMARIAGFKIPATLCSNNPGDIRYFVLRHEREGVVYRPLAREDGLATDPLFPYDSYISFVDLPDNAALQSVPGVFQVEVQAQYELKVLCFGDWLLPLKIMQNAGKISVEPCYLPEEMKSRIRIFMNSVGLIFGSLSFSLDKKNDYIFLEVDDMSEFLWVEEYCPEISTLDMMVQFILRRNREFVYNPGKTGHRLSDYVALADEQVVINCLKYK